jgi:hypothetical protein
VTQTGQALKTASAVVEVEVCVVVEQKILAVLGAEVLAVVEAAQLRAFVETGLLAVLVAVSEFAERRAWVVVVAQFVALMAQAMGKATNRVRSLTSQVFEGHLPSLDQDKPNNRRFL